MAATMRCLACPIKALGWYGACDNSLAPREGDARLSTKKRCIYCGRIWVITIRVRSMSKGRASSCFMFI